MPSYFCTIPKARASCINTKMKKISEFHHPEGSTFVGWIYSENIIKKSFNSEIYAILLKCLQKVLIIELKKEKDNAILLDGYGNLIRRIKNPDSQAVCFGDVYYINDELTLISRRSDASMLAVVIDEKGNLVRVYETK